MNSAFLDRLIAPPREIPGELRRTKGSCSNCGKQKRVMFFIRGSQICASCVSSAGDTLPHPATRMAIIRGIRRMIRALNKPKRNERRLTRAA